MSMPPRSRGRVGEDFDAKAFAASKRRSYELQDFSDRYRATLEVEDNDGVFRPGIVRVFARGNATPLLEVASPELVVDTDAKGTKVKANVHELPYGEQSVLIYDDFNFDGIKDLAVMDGQNSCYHGPSYQVYLGPQAHRQSRAGLIRARRWTTQTRVGGVGGRPKKPVRVGTEVPPTVRGQAAGRRRWRRARADEAGVRRFVPPAPRPGAAARCGCRCGCPVHAVRRCGAP
ncbi:hypothetical protein NB693_24540 [Pantoea ananatis]|uniref:XAC2610-related protein n=1 Tax=Pantoea ananas TaxID=553 RepID=UPI00222052D6|nr:hypothetical protein [Pantoea ananatis]